VTDVIRGGTADQETADLAREWALRAVLEIVRVSSDRLAPRPVPRDGSDPNVSVSIADPITKLRVATKLKFAARQLTLDYARRARGAGHSWEEIGVALGLDLLDETGVSVADAAFDFAVGTAAFGRCSFAWVCCACRRTVIDHGPQGRHPADGEDGHASQCPRLASRRDPVRQGLALRARTANVTGGGRDDRR
jgi:hypothetical protein